jgi:hypothetical protein
VLLFPNGKICSHYPALEARHLRLNDWLADLKDLKEIVN